MNPRGNRSGACAVALSVVCVTAGLAGEREVRGKVEKVTSPAASQLSARHPVQVVTDGLVVGGVRMAVVVDRGRLKVATEPGEAPTASVSLKRPVKFRPDGSGDAVPVRFAETQDGLVGFAAEGRSYSIAGEKIVLLDADIDGRFTIDDDVYQVVGTTHALPLGRSLVIGRSEVEIAGLSEDGLRLTASVEEIEGDSDQVATLDLINRLRINVGLPAVSLDAELTSGCTEHARYLSGNGWTGSTNPHDQTLGPKGASEAGKRAAEQSVICKGVGLNVIQGFWDTYYHRVMLASPTLGEIGISEQGHGVAVIDVHRGREGMVEAIEGWGDFVAVPSHGSTGHAIRSVSEKPTEPVPDLGARGFPLMLVFLDTRGPAPEIEAQLFEVSKGGRERERPLLIADPGKYWYVRGAVPERPLKAKTNYRVEYRFTLGGEQRVESIRFQTG